MDRPVITATPRYARGMSLLEVMLVLAVLVALIVVVTRAVDFQRRAGNQEDLVSLEVRELDQVAAASGKYIAKYRSGWALGSRQAYTITNLVSEGFLPANFANRSGALGETPFGQSYNVVSIVDATSASTIRTVVWESGAHKASRLERSGVQNVAAAIQGLKDLIAQKISGEKNRHGGRVGSGTMNATGAFSGWTRDLTSWLQTAPSTHVSVVLMGFPELGDTCATPPCPTSTGPRYEDCVVVQATCSGNWVSPFCPNGSVTTPTCPAGKVEAGSYPHCGHNQSVFSSTEVGSLTMGSYVHHTRRPSEDGFGYTCNTGCSVQCNPDGPLADNVHRNGTVSLNNVIISDYECSVTYTRTNQSTCALESGISNWPTNSPNSGRDKICCTVRN